MPRKTPSLPSRRDPDAWRDDFDYKPTSYSRKTYAPLAPRCHTTHPPLTMPGTDLVIRGGSCLNPHYTEADVYIGLDLGMKSTARSWPWKKGVEFLFAITDMRAPSNPEEFKKLINWIRKSMESGKSVHVGCIGGHGRTGTVFSALVSTFGEKDATTYVRNNYCHKAVESSEQIDFLHKHFGVPKGKPTKGFSSYSKGRATYPTNPKGKPFQDDLFDPMDDLLEPLPYDYAEPYEPRTSTRSTLGVKKEEDSGNKYWSEHKIASPEDDCHPIWVSPSKTSGT